LSCGEAPWRRWLIPAVDVTASTIRIKLYKKSYSTAMSAAPGYAELNCLPNFSFQRGASQCEALVARAAALAITDEIRI
jgi:hypothetical protein